VAQLGRMRAKNALGHKSGQGSRGIGFPAMATAASRPARDAGLLASIAAGLHPERPPFYVSASSDGRPDGWYWAARGDSHLTYLGRNVIWAERRLLELQRGTG
jgi:hypothetical protein